MGNDFTKEYPSTWDERDVQEWKQTVAAAQLSFYLGFDGALWDKYEHDEYDLLRSKICFALYGPPIDTNNNAAEIEQLYSYDQRKAAEVIRDKIVEVYKQSQADYLYVAFVFVCCKQDANEFYVPVFRVRTETKYGVVDRAAYVDTNCRVYTSWPDWEANNRMPMLKYCYPTRGFYTCSGNDKHVFDPAKSPDLTYGTSPACDFISRLGRQCDLFSGVTSLGAGGVAIAAMFTPIAPVVLTVSAVTGMSAALYGTGRSIDRLVDKGKHSESLTDLESSLCWLTILTTPAHLVTSGVNAAVARGAQQSGRVFSQTIRTAVTILNCTTVGLDSAMFVVGLSNLIEKAKNNQLTPLDVAQFSMSIFFFGHMLIQPKTAGGIIKQAQNEHITAYMKKLETEDAQKGFAKFVADNRGKHEMRDNSKIIRTINRVEDPDRFFGGAERMGIKVELGGRKGKTVLLNDGAHRVDPNKIFFEPTKPNATFDMTMRANISQAFGITVDEIDNFNVNGNELFRDLSDHQVQRVKTVLGGSAGRNYNKDIIKAAQAVAEKLGCSGIDDFLATVELVAVEMKGSKGGVASRAAELTKNIDKFVAGIETDLENVRALHPELLRKYTTDLKAVYHARKHGPEFNLRIPDQMTVYLKDIPDKLFRDMHLRNITRPEGSNILIKTYTDPKLTKFGILVTRNGTDWIATLYQNVKAVNGFEAKLREAYAKSFQLPDVHEMQRRLAQSYGLSNGLIQIRSNGSDMPLEEYAANSTSDPAALHELARILHALIVVDED